MTVHRNCDGVGRRGFVKAGVLGGLGLNLAGRLNSVEAGEVKEESPDKAGIFIILSGGPSHMDTFDLKPDAPSEFRGTFNPIKTNVAGVEICEHLPKLANVADKFAILRGVSHTLGAHALAREYVSTGTKPLASLQYPGFGSIVSRESDAPLDIPSYVAIPGGAQGPGYLGVKYAALNTGGTPRAGQPFQVRGVSLPNGLTIDEVEKRHNLLRDLDGAFAGYEKNSQLLTGLDRFGEQSRAIVTSKRARQAFDISQESPTFAKTFDEEAFSQSCLLAARLVESGVKFVTITLGGWDTHQDNFTKLKDTNLPKLDAGVASLLSGLDEKGLLDSTALLVGGEFGRTPKINTRSAEGGRDHYPRCMFMLMAGGGVRGGQVVGESDDKATLPKNEAITPDDVAATYFHTLGIDHNKEYDTDTGRPITIVRNGNLIEQVYS